MANPWDNDPVADQQPWMADAAIDDAAPDMGAPLDVRSMSKDSS